MNLDAWEKSLDANFGHKYTLRESLKSLYYELLVSLAIDNRNSLRKICEGNLARHFEKGLDWMDPHIQNLKVKNIANGNDISETILQDIDIKVVDYFHTFGSFIDRKQNQKYGVRRSPMQYQDNYTHYFFDPVNFGPDSTCDMPEKLTSNVQLLIEVRSKLKLDAIDHDGRGLIETKLHGDDQARDEVHYMLVENVMEEYDLSWKILFKPFMNVVKQNKYLRNLLLMHALKDGWVITDFDGCLNGNPID